MTCDANVGVLRMAFSDRPIGESCADKSGVILDYAPDGSLVGIEILDASKQVSNPSGLEYSVVSVKSA